jgi:hypothetical protein
MYIIIQWIYELLGYLDHTSSSPVSYKQILHFLQVWSWLCHLGSYEQIIFKNWVDDCILSSLQVVATVDKCVNLGDQSWLLSEDSNIQNMKVSNCTFFVNCTEAVRLGLLTWQKNSSNKMPRPQNVSHTHWGCIKDLWFPSQASVSECFKKRLLIILHRGLPRECHISVRK